MLMNIRQINKTEQRGQGGKKHIWPMDFERDTKAIKKEKVRFVSNGARSNGHQYTTKT